VAEQAQPNSVEKTAQEPFSPSEAAANKSPAIDSGDTAWMIMSSALVMLMLPG